MATLRLKGPELAADAAYKAGFRGQDLVRMVAIAGRESRYNPSAENLNAGTGDHSIGLWQINQLAHKGKYGSDQQLHDPYRNARAAFSLFKQAGLQPWSTKNSYGPEVPTAEAAVKALGDGGGSSRGNTTDNTAQTTAPVPMDDGGSRQQALLAYVQDRGNPNALLGLAGSLKQLAPAGDTPSYGDTPAAPTGTLRPQNGSKGGAQSALDWVQSKVGDPSSRETGTNSGGLASYANKRFGLSNAPWCAMFTSLAITKGGAPESARTASVAQVRQKAQAGGQGYVKGILSGKQARPGDLILFGDAHIGMVQSVSKGRINYIGGNQSDNVTQASVPVGQGDIVRPAYR